LARHARSLARNRHYFEPYLDLALTPTQQALLRQELVTLDFVTARKDLLAVEVDKVVSARPGLRQLVHHLATIPGISAFSAAWIVAETGPFARFHNVGQFLSYCGLCPRVVSSAGKTYSAHLTRRSNKYLRSIFFRAAGVVCNFVKKDSALKRYATRVVKRKGRYSWKLACCIVAAKVARVAFAIVKKRVPFSPSGGTGALSARVRRGFSVTDRKTLRRARNCLRRVKRVETLGQDLTEDVESLAKALDAALGQKD
jgi:transposase